MSIYNLCYYLVLPAIDGDTMSPDFIPCEPGVSHLYPQARIRAVRVIVGTWAL